MKRASKKSSPAKGQGFTPAQIAKVNSLRDSSKTPTDVLRAFLGGSIQLRDITIPPIDMARFMGLEAINSPFIDSPAERREIKAIDMAHAMVIMLADLPELRRLCADTEALESAAWELASRIPVADLNVFAGTLNNVIQSGFNTVIAEKKSKE